jgi:hypothetical protein
MRRFFASYYAAAPPLNDSHAYSLCSNMDAGLFNWDSSRYGLYFPMRCVFGFGGNILPPITQADTLWRTQ